MAEGRPFLSRSIELTIIVTLVSLVILQEYVAITMNYGTLGHGLGLFKHADTNSKHRISYHNVTFGEPKVLVNPTDGNDAAWQEALMPDDEGWLLVKYNETMNLKHGVSVFHALHCLKMIRQGLKQILVDKPSTHRRHDHEDNEFLRMNHIPHCISYLAQYISCTGDSTIESPFLMQDSSGHITDHQVDGREVVHRCKDTSLVWDVVKKSHKNPVEQWEKQDGDTIESVFG
ncbi:hypothetical protein FSARC_10976 [Fusarium sarcochroum]|uniref:Oxidase ustYa n=1 Tax=Fusarium sarcochroum TaxID=1208366 RepID=A0A8H4TIW3_9HYPO|nr:hypothetical protein FSARC_10976 [Fusarium sarcochroum]